jgi:hypothetical protein
MKYCSNTIRNFPAIVLISELVDLVNKTLDMDEEYWNDAMQAYALWNCRYLFK